MTTHAVGVQLSQTAMHASIRDWVACVCLACHLRRPVPCVHPPSGASLAPQLDLNVESWVEWEEAVLRPAVYAGDTAALAAAVARLAAALAGGRAFLAGSTLSLADICVYATLSPVAGGCCCGSVAWVGTPCCCTRTAPVAAGSGGRRALRCLAPPPFGRTQAARRLPRWPATSPAWPRSPPSPLRPSRWVLALQVPAPLAPSSPIAQRPRRLSRSCPSPGSATSSSPRHCPTSTTCPTSATSSAACSGERTGLLGFTLCCSEGPSVTVMQSLGTGVGCLLQHPGRHQRVAASTVKSVCLGGAYQGRRHPTPAPCLARYLQCRCVCPLLPCTWLQLRVRLRH